VISLIAAVGEPSYGTFVAVLVFGVVLATFGHIIRSQTLIIAGLLVLGLVSAYFTAQFLFRS
jgi:hypothetical protein